MAISKTSINLSERAKEKLAEFVDATGLSQSQIIEALLTQAESGHIIFLWRDDHAPDAAIKKAKAARDAKKKSHSK